jgi:hypothetical protein
LYRDFEDRYNEADTWACLGDTYLAADDQASAYTAWHNAVVILDEFDHPDAARIRGKLKKLGKTPECVLTDCGR